MRREFHLQGDPALGSWTIEVIGCECLVTTRRAGAGPRETRTRFESPELARAAAEREIRERQLKGYAEKPATQGDPRAIRAQPPQWIRIGLDDALARFVGMTRSGESFFLTFPFVPASGGRTGANYIALYVFDETGALKEARVFDEKASSLLTQDEVDAFVEDLLGTLDRPRFCDIEVSPFSIVRFGRTFGLVFDPGAGDGDARATLEPGGYMTFRPPWDGDYDA